MTNEVYRLTFDHFIDDGESRIRLDQQIVVQMIYDRSYAPSVICINSMLDSMLEKMRDEVLRRATKERRNETYSRD